MSRSMTYVYPLSLAVISISVMLAERIAPWRRDQKQLRPAFLSDLAHLVFNGHFLGVILFGIAENHVLPLIDAILADGGLPAVLSRNVAATWPLAVQIVVALFTIDLVHYLVHNLLHRVPWLWELHKTHHSVVDGEMDWIVSFRFQWTEVVVYKTIQYVPLAFLGFRTEAILVHAIFGTLIGHLNHSNLDLGYGWLRYVFNSPRMHIWHHNYDADAKSTINFGIIFSVWDWIFGTARIPSRSPARIGFDGVESFPKGFLAHTSWPLARVLGSGTGSRIAASIAGGALIALGWIAHGPLASPGRAPEAPMLGEQAAASQPSSTHHDFPYAATAAEADRAIDGFGEEARRQGYAHPEHMVTAGELARALGSPRLVLLDVRPEDRFEAGHVPSAQRVFRDDYSTDAPIPGLSKAASELEQLLRTRGVGVGSVVVLYGDGGPEPYRLWWTLLVVGGYPTRVLDGGLVAWKAGGHRVAGGPPRPARGGDIRLAPQAGDPALLWSDVERFLAGAARSRLIDARSAKEFSGEIKHPEAARAGRIPGSVHMDWMLLFKDAQHPALRAPEDLRREFESRGIDLDGGLIVTTCQSGTRSALTYFVLHQIGLPPDRIMNYDGSWAEYSRLALPLGGVSE